MAFDKMELKDIEVWDGNHAAAQALRQCQIDVVAAYPITPSTPIVEGYAKFLADGYVEGEFVMVESEHAAMSGCIGAAAAGGRVATATSSQGLALMSETLYQASGMRLPIVLNLVNRALASPLNVNGDHSDMYMVRDSGWIQLDAFSPQEAYDLNLIAFKVAEDHDVRLPAIVNQDGFMTSHTAQGVSPLSDDVAYGFVGEYKPMNDMLDFEHPVTHGVQTEEDWHFEHKARQHNDLMTKVLPKIQTAFDDFEKLTGRKYNLVEKYDMDDADICVVCMGSSVETAREVATEMRAKGIKAGVVGIRVLRPIPFFEIIDALKDVKAIAALDRSSPNGAAGMLFNELAGALFNTDTKALLSGYVYGLGGRDLTKKHLVDLYTELQANVDAGKVTTKLQQFIGVRGPKLAYL
ncbi:MAG: 2-ketoisovalerate ferredoxin oxidoreductase [Sulfurimonas sp. RIFOXYD12_FULL_33_39]|uniref:2-oxoacid:ferredoxin oxidoreductase subunit alpha n=1 Tax=unclassified Sulfurimonas TaxID=2623549 RepID=UPI0008BB5F6E|nr:MULTISPECIES: 2-oxoacid:ferredoxin oxidoreductase subunit alpha [unclassified Sulfurimonas]OHE09816.1 MAG: 2-ketoisovalerate ferredoxin oxidoreductase [Sulfurimonas sp. RIFOXYD12_FULL_33_39]OHE13676.1 MAG: 2-ketoisovalerate ferredoxin oxidoreductase [Sulfurimonas sp. RIFOXYD2_FULL_34_21]DAB28116.1 MAG TPA: 2-ketoisovalerate ferredoxin oxidoreductase [Sulfurimonas sp. UBA10385]